MKAMKGFSQWVVAAVGATMLAFALRGEADTVTVFVGNTNLIGTAADVFVPPITNCFLGDQVVWVWEGSFHSSTSGTSTSTNATPDGLWNSGVNSQPHSFTNTFNSPGTYTYYCSVHFSIGMTGAVNVASVPAPKTVTVFVGNTNLIGTAADVFVPPSTNINVNDSVVWDWEGSFHSTTSGTSTSTNATPNGLWDSGVNSRPHLFTNTFSAPGSFTYYCSVHFSVGMTGVVNVAGLAAPPTVSITNPVNNATFSAPASFTLTANASSASGTITNVQFFEGASSLANVTTAPYAVPVSSLGAADYTFSAVAFDNTGLTATNAIAVHVVTPVPIVLSAPQFLPPSDFRFDYTANPGLTYTVQRTSNLNSGSWTTLSTNTAASSPVLFDDPAASGNPGFYRVHLQPNSSP